MANPFPFASGSVLTAANLNSIGDPTTFTPNFVTGLTVGTGAGAGVFNSYYVQVNEMVFVSVDFQFQSGSAVTGDLRMVLPIQASSTWHVAANLSGAAWDSSAGAFWALMGRPYDSSEVRIRYMAQSSAPAQAIYAQTVSGSAPFSWTTGDKFTFSTWYVKA